MILIAVQEQGKRVAVTVSVPSVCQAQTEPPGRETFKDIS